jgi:cell division protein FtsQ
MSMRNYNWKKILITTVWLLAGAGTIVLLGAAMQKKNQRPCTDIKIEITGVERHMFIDEKDVLDILNSAGPVTGNKLSAINLRAIETVVERNPWVKNAEMFLDNNQVLQVEIEERQPVARVFTLDGNSFYLDSAAMRLPLSDKISARVPVFTSFPSNKKILAKPDSALLGSVVKLGRYINADSFWMAQVAQVDITPAGFELVPIIGDHIVALGNADELDRKFNRLYTFYRKAWLQNGINTYERIDVQYNNQVVAVRKGTYKKMVDSARSREIMNELMARAGLYDSSALTAATKLDISKSVKDSVKITRPISPLSTQPNKLQNSVVNNNKTRNKTLSNGKKSTPVIKKAVGSKQAPKAKAVMTKNK